MFSLMQHNLPVTNDAAIERVLNLRTQRPPRLGTRLFALLLHLFNRQVGVAQRLGTVTLDQGEGDVADVVGRNTRGARGLDSHG